MKEGGRVLEWEEGGDEGGGSTSTIPHLDSQEGADFDRQWQEAGWLQNATCNSPSASISTIGEKYGKESICSIVHANLTSYGTIIFHSPKLRSQEQSVK